MESYLKCLTQANEYVKTSELADFEFTDPREGLIFAQWVGATLPLDEESYIDLDWELGSSLVGEVYQPWHSLLSKPAWANEHSSIIYRRYVRHVYIPWGGSTKSINRSHAYYVKKIKEGGMNPKEFIFWTPMNTILADHDFWEYIAGCHFRDQGYIVTKWYPTCQEGIPDLCAIRESSIIEPLRKLHLIRSGCFTFELELPRAFGLIETQPLQSEESNIVVIEAESKSVPSGIEQLFRRGDRNERKPGYLKQGYYDEGYVVGPNYPKYDEKVGIISNKEDGSLFLAVCPQKYSVAEMKEECIREFSTVIKLLLLRNFTAEEIFKLFPAPNSVSFYDYHLYIESEVRKLDFNTLAQMVAEKAR